VKATNILAIAGILSASVASADIIEVSLTGSSNGSSNAWSVEMGAYVTEGGNEANWLGGIGYNSYYGTYYDFNGSGSLDYDNVEALNDGETGTILLDLGAGDYDVMAYDSYGDGWVAYSGDPHLNVTNLTTGEVIVDHHVNSSGAELAGSFTVIPAPGALALLGLAGIAGRRRRRA